MEPKIPTRLMNNRPRGTSFLDAPIQVDPVQVVADFAFLGIPYGVPYDMENVSPLAAEAPQAVRVACESMDYEIKLLAFDFDIGKPLMANAALRIVDCGDVAGDPRDLEGNAQRATEAVRGILAGGAVPLVVGGDHAIPPLVVAAYEDRGPLDVLQIDAHLDFREEWQGVESGYSSPMRRLRQMPWVRHIAQVGLRGTGRSRQQEVDAALASGNLLVTADEVHERGVDSIAASFPEGGKYYITIDVDGLDPSCMPGTPWPVPGGLTYYQVTRLLRGLSIRGTIVGVDFCEFAPSLDVNQWTALAISRLMITVIGLVSAPAHA